MVKQAFATLRPIPGRLEFMVGLQKLPFSVVELDASARFEFNDFGGPTSCSGASGSPVATSAR